MNIKNKYSRTVIGSIFTLLLALTAQLAVAGSGPSVLPATAHAYGKDYAGWSAAWLKWALSIPAATNPMYDTTGEFANIGQSGKVWFLAGTGGGTVTRTITIPEGTALFFPIVNSFWINTPEFGDPPWSPTQEDYARAIIAGVVDTATGLYLKVDGRTLKNPEDFRFQSNPPVMVNLPQGDVFGVTTTLPPGSYGPVVGDGYWVLLAPLSAGPHTIQFKGGFSPSFALDVTFKVTVKSNHHNGHLNHHSGHDD